MNSQLTPYYNSEDISVYTVSSTSGDSTAVERWLMTTPQTRLIANDSAHVGTRYTTGLRQSITNLFKHTHSQLGLEHEDSTVILHILRGGLNFGLREAMAEALGWNRHKSAFISSQRVKDESGDWHITENRYQKVTLPNNAHIVLGDVVATGVSLEHALNKVIDIALEQGTEISRFTFLTIGSQRAEEILAKIDSRCAEVFPGYVSSDVIYIEGVFGVPDEESELHVKLTGTDLLRSPALLAPEFIESQKEKLSYAIERCTIYDAGSRAFDVQEYMEDVQDYWKLVQNLAQQGTTYIEYLTERFPEDTRLHDEEFVQQYNTAEVLLQLATKQLEKLV